VTRGAWTAAVLPLLLGACATPGPPRAYFLEDSYARYYAAPAGRTLRVERDGTVLDVTCLPLETAQEKPLEDLPRVMCPDARIPVLGKARRTGGDWDLSEFDVEPPTGRCRPLFPSADGERGPQRSCWNRLWEVPAAVVLVPLAAVGVAAVVTAPIWVPLVLLLR
jgi:hypothetical protein